ncbi:Cation/H+ exchanger [Baffinella frigidus]|nr:Cation/H+ exchanger [Cryptophyta sp. CCMP2293]
MWQSGYCLKKATFFRNFPTILVLAVFGTIISAMIVGVGTFWLGQKGIIYELSFLNSIVYGALLASTDPVATLAIFQALKVDETLYMLAFGESVINDAVSIVLFETVLSQYYIHQEHHSMAHFPIQFVMKFSISICIGVVSALFAALTFRLLINTRRFSLNK